MSTTLREIGDASLSFPASPAVQSVPRTFHTRIGKLLNVKAEALLRVASIGLLVVWGIWWGVSTYRGELIGCLRSWVPNPYFAIDFLCGGYGPAQTWLQGNDPYAGTVQNVQEMKYPLKAWLQGNEPYAGTGMLIFIYPPPVTRMFAWCGLVSPDAAIVIWVCILASIATGGAYFAWRTRHQLGLCNIPLPTALAIVLCSTPVVFAMERGNCDLLSVLFIILGVMLCRWKSPVAQFAAGAVLALAPWLKLYPGLLGVGLIGLRRWQTLAGFIVAGLAIGAWHAEELPKFIRQNRQYTESTYRFGLSLPQGPVHAWTHSLSDAWPRIWVNTPLKFLSRINGFMAVLLILGPLLSWVTYHVYRCPERDRFAFPFLIWVTALATFVPPAANDYSLVFLPIAAVAVWDRKDPIFVQLAMLALLIWLQPVGLGISGKFLILFKLGGLIAVGISLAERVAAVTGSTPTPHWPLVPRGNPACEPAPIAT